MHISEEEIQQKKRELGQESAVGVSADATSFRNDELISTTEREAVEPDQAAQVDEQHPELPQGTQQRNQYRYGGERP